MSRTTHPLHQATVLPDGFEVLAEEAGQAACRAVVDVMKEQGYNPTGDFMPGEVAYLDSFFEALVAAYLLNSPEHDLEPAEEEPSSISVAQKRAGWDVDATQQGYIYEVSVDAMEPDALPRDEGVDVFVLESGIAVVLTAPTRRALYDYLAAHWGDDEWITHTVASAAAIKVTPQSEAEASRRRSAAAALKTYTDRPGCDTGEMRTNIIDLITNLMHLADTCNAEGRDVIDAAERHYRAEIREQTEQARAGGIPGDGWNASSISD